MTARNTHSTEDASRSPARPHSTLTPLTPPSRLDRTRSTNSHHKPRAERLIIALSLSAAAAMSPKALAVRGGAAVGPIDEAHHGV